MHSQVLFAVVAILGASGVTASSAQVNWSGDNRPVHGAVVDNTVPSVTFEYAVYDPGRTEAEGRGEGLGARLYYRNADAAGEAFTEVEMHYAGQTGPFGPNNDLFVADVPIAAFGSSQLVEYFTIVFDSLATPVHADTTQQDAAGNSPPFQFSFGVETMPHNVYFHWSLCLNGQPAQSPPIVRIAPRDGSASFDIPMDQVSTDQIPDLWERDLPLLAGFTRVFDYQFLLNGQEERDGSGNSIVHSVVLDIGVFLQGDGTQSWGGGPLGCHLTETLQHDIVVHFSLCLSGVAHSGQVCISGNTPELGDWQAGIPLTNLQINTDPDLFEGDIRFPAGTSAVVQYKHRINDCADWENLFGGRNDVTNRFLYMDGSVNTLMAPTDVWANQGPNLCAPPVTVTKETWSQVRQRYR